MATTWTAPLQHPVLSAADRAAEALATMRRDAWSQTADEATQSLVAAARLAAQSRATYLALLREAVGEGDQDRSRDAVGTLVGALNVTRGRVRADLAEAEATAPGTGPLPRLGAALAAGETTPEHVSVSVRALAAVPSRMVRERAEDIDAVLTEHARTFTAADCRKLGGHLLATLDPDRAERFDPDAHERREAHLAVDSTGMGRLRAQLHAAATDTLKAVLDHLSAPRPVATGDGDRPARDPRTAPQRRADALAEMARLAAGSLQGGTGYGESARVVVHATEDQLADAEGRRRDTESSADDDAWARTDTDTDTECDDAADTRATADPAPRVAPGAASSEQTGPLSATSLGLVACDATVDRVVLSRTGRILQMATLGRFFTPGQRRAMAARDGGCAFPGCDRPPGWTDAHHVVPWSRDGPTDTDNGVLLCEAHHTEIHLGRWTITVRDGVPWFVPPRSHDPTRTPVRNTLHDAVRATRRFGQQLALGL
ncbi:hypothetical protein GCM10027047_12880 [Rhodococcus aerolatus]